MRVMGLDYGARTVGVAVSDELLVTAQPLETITRERETKLRRTFARLEELIREYQVERIVVGLPKRLDNREGERCEKTREFAGQLGKRTGLDVVFWDERFTTSWADSVLEEANVRWDRRKEYIDKIAASLILENYLESLQNK